MRPALAVVLTPSTPMNDERLATAGSCSTIAARRCWRSAIAANDTDSGASDTPRMTPVSCTGKKPFGTTTYRRNVAARVATKLTSTAVCRRSTQRSVVA